MDTIAQSAKAPDGRNHPDGTEAPRGAEEWMDDLAVLDAWTSSLVSVRGRSQATAKRYRRLVERLLEDAGKPIAELDQRLIEKHLRRLHVTGRGESVRRGLVVAIRSLGEWCLTHGIVDANPGASLSGPRPYRREIKVLTVAEVGRLLWGNSPGTLPQDPLEMRNRVLLGVSYMAGLRASEIGPLEAEGVVWHEVGQIFSILVRRGKGSGQDIRLPLDRPVSRMLGVWLAVRPAGRFLWGRPLTRGAVRNIFLDRCAEVGRLLWGTRQGRCRRILWRCVTECCWGSLMWRGCGHRRSALWRRRGWCGTRRARFSAFWCGAGRARGRICASRWTVWSLACSGCGWRFVQRVGFCGGGH